MKIKQKFNWSILLLTLPSIGAVYAAQPINLNHQKVSVLQSFISAHGVTTNGNNLHEVSRTLDFNKTLHVRVKQTYQGYPVQGGEAIIHIPNGESTGKNLIDVLSVSKKSMSSMNGLLYQGLEADLNHAPAVIFNKAQAQKALDQAINTYRNTKTNAQTSEPQSQLIVYLDKNQKAHWAYQVGFTVEPNKESDLPAKPRYILDATTFKIYQSWDDIKTQKHDTQPAFGGGFGGNKKMGKMVYDGLTDHLPRLNVRRNDNNNTCYMQNDDVTVKNYNNRKIMSFDCEKVDADHNDVYWNGETDAVNEGYSPTNDALFGGAVIKNMYRDWYDVPVLTEDGKPMMLHMVVHCHMDNAYWDPSKKEMTFGDGITMFYPLTSLGVAAHEISHGFTEQHSGLAYYGQSGGMNEAFSDMAAQGAELYAYGKSSWQIGPEIFKEEDRALRYMDQPSKDCRGKTPGNWCSIDSYDQYHDGLDVHFSSGIFNRAYYLIANSPNWDARKAFDVMVQANMNYWTSNSSFKDGACGVIKATKDYQYDVESVVKAFETVGVDTKECN